MPANNEPITIHTVSDFFPDGRVTEGALVDEFERSITLLADLPLVEATGLMEDESAFVEPYVYDKSSTVTDLDHGPLPHTYGTYRRKQPMQMRESALEYIKKHKMFVPSAYQATVDTHVSMTIKRMALDMEHDVFYANPLDNTAEKKYMAGLNSRFNLLTDIDGKVTSSGDYQGEVISTITLDGGGTTGGSLASVYMIVPGSDAACLCYPAGSELYGFEYDPESEYRRQTDENGGYVDKRVDLFRFTGGLSLRQKHAAIRIANVDFLSDAGIGKLVDCLYSLGDVVPMDLVNRMMVYIPKRASSKLNKYFADKVTTITPQNLGFTAAFKLPYIEGIGYLRPTEQLLLTEGKVA